MSCISPEWLVRFHTGYEIDEQDVHDVMVLHRRFGVPLPDEYIAFRSKVRDDQGTKPSERLVNFNPLSTPHEAKEILGAALYEPTRQKIEALLTSIYVASDTSLFGLIVEDIVVAVMGIRFDSQAVAEILHIAVNDAYRGMGYGRLLIELVVQEEELSGLYAETDRDALGFYQHCGFTSKSLGEKYSGVERFLCKWSTPVRFFSCK